MYSLDYHTVRNFLYVKRHFGSDERANSHVPSYARRVVDEYNKNGAVDARLAITRTAPVGPALPPAPPSGRTPAPGVGGNETNAFGAVDPSVIGGALGFVLFSAIASKVMGG